MERNLANEILTTLHESSTLIDKTLGELKDTCPEEPFRACARLLGVVMSDMFDTVMAPIYDEHPDLAPDWYRDGPPRGTPEIPPLSLTKSARQALLASFNAAYEKVQLALRSLSQLSNPVDIASYSLGLHQISATLCRARIALLMARAE